MERDVDILEISDGRFYSENDMVRCDTNGCKGCSLCCHVTGDSIVLDPYDVYRLCGGLNTAFDALLEDKLTLSIYNGLVLPCLMVTDEATGCAFLNAEGRCSIHALRPGFCRLFPLGRYYEKGDFTYFLQVHECPMPNKTKIKVKKWIGLTDADWYRRFVNQWHELQKELTGRMGNGDDVVERNLTMTFLKLFFRQPYDSSADFYPQFEERLGRMRALLG